MGATWIYSGVATFIILKVVDHFVGLRVGEAEEEAGSEGVAHLAAGIAELLRDPAKRRRLGAAARRRIEEEYSAARMTMDYLRVYEEAIAACAARPGGAR